MTVEASFDRAVNSVALARHFTAEVLGGVPTAVVFDIMLLVSELATNAIVHAGTPFGLRVERTDTLVRVELTDGGRGSIHSLSPSKGDPHGRGLQIVERLSDQWGTTELADGRRSVWFVRSLPSPSWSADGLKDLPSTSFGP